MVTLYHWDLPSAVHAVAGGWANPRGCVADDEFAAFARVCFREFGADVKQCITLSGLRCTSMLGYVMPPIDPCRAAHNLLRAHAGEYAGVYREVFQERHRNHRIYSQLGLGGSRAWHGRRAGSAALQRYLAFNLAWFADSITAAPILR